MGFLFNDNIIIEFLLISGQLLWVSDEYEGGLLVISVVFISYALITFKCLLTHQFVLYSDLWGFDLRGFSVFSSWIGKFKWNDYLQLPTPKIFTTNVHIIISNDYEPRVENANSRKNLIRASQLTTSLVEEASHSSSQFNY